MNRDKSTSRATLARYAALLGRSSLAAMALRTYDEMIALGRNPKIRMVNSGFLIERGDGVREEPKRFA